MSAVQLPKKSAIYVRVSTSFQIDKDSLQVQKRELIAYSSLVLGISDYEIFEDPGFSGKNTERPAYKRMIARLRTGEFSHLLVWKIDRISRNLLDFSEMYAELKRLGVTFVSKNEQFDTSTAIGEAMLKIILVFAELERKMTAERVTSVMLSRASNGQWNGGKIPFGYDWDSESKTFSINQEEAKIFYRMCDLYEEQQSLVRVCEMLNDNGMLSRSGKRWNPTTLSGVIKNIWNTGTYRYNVSSIGKGIKSQDPSEWITVPDHHPALIEIERYDRLCFLLQRNRRNGFKEGDTFKSKKTHIFAGLLKCGNCGNNMVATPGRRLADGWRPSYYMCSLRRRSKTCQNKYVSDAYLCAFIFEMLSVILNAQSNISTLRSAKDLENRILSGVSCSAFSQIQGIRELYEAMVSGNTGLEFHSPNSDVADIKKNKDYSVLAEEKNRITASMQRLQSLYIHGDIGLSEKDYLIERKAAIDDLNRIEKELSELEIKNSKMDEDEFIAKGSYFLMVDHLLSFKPGKVSKIIRSIDPEIPKLFMNSIFNRIVVQDGEIESIVFRNGITLNFIH